MITITIKNNKHGETVVSARLNVTYKLNSRLAENPGILKATLENVENDMAQEINYGEITVKDMRQSATEDTEATA